MNIWHLDIHTMDGVYIGYSFMLDMFWHHYKEYTVYCTV
jgi:hypothetical protein